MQHTIWYFKRLRKKSRDFEIIRCDLSHIIVENLRECKKFAKLQNLSLSLSALLMSGWLKQCLCIFDVKVFSMMNQQKSRRALVSISCPFVNEQYVMIWRTPKFCKPDFANFIQQRMFWELGGGFWLDKEKQPSPCLSDWGKSWMLLSGRPSD